MQKFVFKPKKYTKEYLKDHDIILRDREFVIEEDADGENIIQRFKIGDGVKPYSALPYISSLYACYPKIVFYDTDYDRSIEMKFGDD